MDNIHWMEPWIASGKQEREPLEIMGFQSKVTNVGFQSKVADVGMHQQLAFTRPSRCMAAPCPTMSNDQDYHISPFSQPIACDESLSDMLLPYQYDKTLDDLLLEHEEPLVQQLAPISQNEQGQFNRTLHIDDSNIILNDDLHIDNGVVINDQQLCSAIFKLNKDAQRVKVLPPLPPLAPAPAQTRRPPMRKGTPSYRENHIHSERQRRQDMTSLFNRLKSVLPNMKHDDLKGDRCTILEHVIEYVQELDKTVQGLGKVKAELMQGEGGAFISNHRLAQQAALASAESVSVRSWGHMDIFITLNCPKQHGLWPNLLAFLQDTLQLDVQNVALSSTPLFCVHSIYAKLLGDVTEGVCFKLKKTLREFVTDHAYSSHIMSNSIS